MKKIFKYTFYLALLALFLIWFANYRVTNTTKDQLYNSVHEIPHNKVGMVLGTTKLLAGGYVNYYFTYRIEATAALYKAGKIDYIVVSGDHSRNDYNEPKDMEQALIERGVPKEKIYLDYAGLRTLDSVYRMNVIFGQDSFTIISQPFHNERAVYIANHLDLNTVAYNAQDVSRNYGFKTMLREKFARVKVLLDNLINKKPKYLGAPVLIGEGKIQKRAQDK
ncbi:SanA/YdcF family protein [Myroides odoratimimus]|uniref:SanA/YdcF family protein n=1 Tax=Myroides odoratimimus TaxID=76832 RepID=UPI002574B3BD|nr:ElyC/SanA/YdcF family protein [Myroides odoratimimus]MDM1528337.1 YdcF family protein [Myroides odoratimimus]